MKTVESTVFPNENENAPSIAAWLFFEQTPTGSGTENTGSFPGGVPPTACFQVVIFFTRVA